MLTYRQQQLSNAQEQVKIARATLETATTKKAKREAAEVLEFWTNKTAFLSNLRYPAFDDERQQA